MALPDGVDVVFDAAFPDNASDSDDNSSLVTDRPRDYHREQYPAYVPPHARGHNVQPGDSFVNFKNRKPGMGDDPDKVMGTDNDKFQRLKLRVNFAMPRKVLDHLKPQFPGIYFHCADNGNHDHPISHVVTQIGTRFLQRRIPAGSNILDVYGNPNACERFNISQADAPKPKHAKALVWRHGAADFIREVNKWGPFFDEETGQERYIRNTLRNAIDDGSLAEYDVLQFIHSLYYENLHVICDALHAPGKKRRLLALVHRHRGKKGSLNGGEQEYVTNGTGLVKQTNVMTNSTYVHNNISSWLFAERKEWFPADQLMYADKGKAEFIQTKGVSWDVHMVNEETWIVEMVPMVRCGDHSDGQTDFEELWDLQEELFSDNESSEQSLVKIESDCLILPTKDGKFVELDLCCKPLLKSLRASCVGRTRDAKLLGQLVDQARHLVNPSTLFGAKLGMPCPEERIYDHVLGAMILDAQREVDLHEAVAQLHPLLVRHMRTIRMGVSFKDFRFGDLVGIARASVLTLRDVNRVLRSKDVVESGLGTIQGYLD